MVTTRAREISTNHAGGQCQGADPLAVGPSAPPTDVPAPPLQQLQEDRLAALAVQVQSLVTVVQGLQHQAAVPQQPEHLLSVPAAIQPSQHSCQRRPPAREAGPRRALSGPSHREASKRPRSPSRRASASPRRQHGKEVGHLRQHRRRPSPSSNSSREGSFDGSITR